MDKKLNYDDFFELSDKAHDIMRDMSGKVQISNNHIDSREHGRLAIAMSTIRLLIKKGLLDREVEFDLIVKVTESIDDVNG